MILTAPGWTARARGERLRDDCDSRRAGRGEPRQDRPRGQTVSPRSEELMHAARERGRGAEVAVTAGAYALAVSAACYAMLDAARAALSEEGRNAKTHRGVGSLHRDLCRERAPRPRARPRRPSPGGHARGRRRRRPIFSEAEAAAAVADGHVLVDAVARLLDAERRSRARRRFPRPRAGMRGRRASRARCSRR